MNGFDFLAGTWDAANRWRTDFLDDSSEWEEFPGVSEAARRCDGVNRPSPPATAGPGSPAQQAHLTVLIANRYLLNVVMDSG